MKDQLSKQTLARYSPPLKANWSGRIDGPATLRFHEVIQLLNLQNQTIEPIAQTSYAIIGFACDEGIKRNQGRTGAAKGPEAFRNTFGRLPISNKKCSYFDIGDIVCTDQDLESSQKALAEIVSLLIKNHYHPIVIGGGHEVAWGHFQGIAGAYAHNHENIAIINFDAHFDLRPLLDDGKGSSGTSFLQMANERKAKNLSFDYTCIGIQSLGNTQQLFDQAKELSVKVITADEIHMNDLSNSFNTLAEVIQKHEKVYVTICLDVFATPFAPGVSAPQPLGLCPWQVIPLLRCLTASKKVVSIDIAELSPILDRDGQTAQLAAILIADYLAS